MKNHADRIDAIVRHFGRFAGRRAGWLVAAMVATALSEGLGLLLLIPLMTLAGVSSLTQVDFEFVNAVRQWAAHLGISLNLTTVLAVFVAMIVVRQLLLFYTAQLAATTRNDYVARVRKELFSAIGETDWKFLTGGRLDQLSQIILLDSIRIGEAALNIVRISSGAILLLANAGVAIYLAPKLAAGVLVTITVLTTLFSNRLGVVHKQGQNVSKIQDEMLRVVENYVDSIRVAKMSGTVERIQGKFSKTIEQLNKELSAYVRQSEAAKLRLQVAGAIAVSIAVLIAIPTLGAGGPGLLLLILITARFIPRVASISQYAHALFNCLPAFEQAQSMLTYCQAHREEKVMLSDEIMVRDSVGLRDVTVWARERSSQAILNHVTIRLRVPEIVALTGPSGAGKSTLAEVLSGLLRPDSGAILIDGSPINRDGIAAWRKSVGYVPQRAALLQGTIAHNLQWALPCPTPTSELDDALDCVVMQDVVASLPAGLNTEISRREGSLSGGERQRLAIARELLRQPKLLILDEATSALDSATEATVIGNIRRYYPRTTVLLISHRATALALAERVLHMADGRLAEIERCEQVSR
jgi:ATP-binding cassette subfamily C protein